MYKHHRYLWYALFTQTKPEAEHKKKLAHCICNYCIATTFFLNLTNTYALTLLCFTQPITEIDCKIFSFQLIAMLDILLC